MLGIRRTGRLLIKFNVSNYYYYSLCFVKSFIGFVKFVFTLLPEVTEQKAGFSAITPTIECFFGCQRQPGGTGDNPSAK